MQNSMNRKTFFISFSSCQLTSEAEHCPTVNSLASGGGTLWVTTLQKATLLWRVMREGTGTEIHTETSFLLTTKDESTDNTNKHAEHVRDLKKTNTTEESSKLDFSCPTSEGVSLTELKCGFSCSCFNDFMVLWGSGGW